MNGTEIQAINLKFRIFGDSGLIGEKRGKKVDFKNLTCDKQYRIEFLTTVNEKFQAAYKYISCNREIDELKMEHGLFQ